MPLSQARPDAVAQVYAKSLLELAEAEGGRDLLESCLGQLEDVLELAREDPRFSEFLSSRILPVASREASLRKIFEGKIHGLTLRFMLLLNEKGRLAHLPAIVAALDALVQDLFGRVEVDVYTAQPIDTDELDRIRERLAEILKKDVIVHPYTDASMIGGVKFRIGDQLVDGSLANRLRRFRDQLGSRGLAKIRARANELMDRPATD